MKTLVHGSSWGAALVVAGIFDLGSVPKGQAQSVSTKASSVKAKLMVVPDDKGFIKVGTPQIYSRQTVFRDRLEEIQYLSDRLKVAKELGPTIQALTDTRHFSANAFQAALEVDPAAGALADQVTKNNLANLVADRQISETNKRVELEKAEAQLAAATRQLADVRSGTVSNLPQSDPATEAKVTELKGKVAELEKQVESLKAAVKVAEAETNRVKAQAVEPNAAAINSKALATGGTAGTTATTQLSYIDKEKVVLELRRYLQNERRKLGFDSGHDASGEVAMDMSMMVTIMPPKGVDAYAVVEALVPKSDSLLGTSISGTSSYTLDREMEQMLNTWADYLTAVAQSEKNFIIERIRAGMPPTDQYFELARRDLEAEARLQDDSLTPLARQKLEDELQRLFSQQTTYSAEIKTLTTRNLELEQEQKKRTAAAAAKAANPTPKTPDKTPPKTADKTPPTAQRQYLPGEDKPADQLTDQELVTQIQANLIKIQDKQGILTKLNEQFTQLAKTLKENFSLVATPSADKTKLDFKPESQGNGNTSDLIKLLPTSGTSLTELSANYQNRQFAKMQSEEPSLDARPTFQVQSMSTSLPNVPAVGQPPPATEVNTYNDENKEQLKRVEEVLNSILTEKEKKELKTNQVQVYERAKKRLLQRYMYVYFGPYVGPYLALEPSQIQKEPEPGHVPNPAESNNQKGTLGSLRKAYLVNVQRQFSALIRKMGQRVRVLSVEPTEQGQNISNVAANQSVQDTVLSLRAILYDGIKGEARYDHYRDQQIYMQTIERKPLIVGFVNGDSNTPSFGWILGPRYEIEMKRRWYQLGFIGAKQPLPAFAQQPTQHQVQVAVGLPASLVQLRLQLNCYWVDPKTGLRKTGMESSEEIFVRLSPDYAALTEALLDEVHGKVRPPRVSGSNIAGTFVLSSQAEAGSGRKHRLTLLGKDLWRAPSVYLDSLPASSVEVMPGLVGVVATFSDPLPRPLSKNGRYNLTISTSEGVDTLYRSVFSPDKEQEQAAESNAQNNTLGIALKTQSTYLSQSFTGNTQLRIPLQVLENRFPMPLSNIGLRAEAFPQGVFGQENQLLVQRIAPERPNSLTLFLGEASKSPVDSLPKLLTKENTPPVAWVNFGVHLPVQDNTSGSVDYKDIVKGAHAICFVDSDREAPGLTGEKTITLKDTEQYVSCQVIESIPEAFFREVHPAFVTAAEKGDLKLELYDPAAPSKVHATCNMRGPSPQPKAALTFVLPAKATFIGEGKLLKEGEAASKEGKVCKLRLTFNGATLKLRSKGLDGKEASLDSLTLKIP